jgi:hypothetical protein
MTRDQQRLALKSPIFLSALRWIFSVICAMSGIKYLRDTHFNLGLLKSSSVVLSLVAARH